MPGPFNNLKIGNEYSVSDNVSPDVKGTYMGLFHVFEKENGEHEQYYAGIGNNEPYVVKQLGGKRSKTRKSKKSRR